MGLADDAKNKFEETKGKAKETIGEKTGDDALEFDGKKEQGSAAIKDAVSTVKDEAKKLANKVQEAFSGDDDEDNKAE
ncbi:CsbD family protein [Trueperella bialowiezensis]|uniref:CsbD-like n=1 Tax=Trueperella bialowiezensis TaxID=312285 RepID=A0A448PGK5_9ACTO|nr:CsbD family protein [Trueperella bialowiezensis]VEI14099.1 CsbD-like [Trueperella bialowiezensis]